MYNQGNYAYLKKISLDVRLLEILNYIITEGALNYVWQRYGY